MKLQHKLVLTVLALTLSLGLVPAATAADPETRGGLLRGEVTAIADGSLTVQTHEATVTLLTDGGTVFDVPGIAEATLNDLAVGDFVAVRAVRNEDGYPRAHHVTVIPNGSLEDEILKGLVSSVDDATFQLRIRGGEVTVVTDEGTVFHVPGIEDASVTDLKARMPVIVMGQYREDGQTFHASAVALIPRRVIQRHVARGELTAVKGDTLVLTTGRDGDERRVLVTDETTFRVPGVEDATIDDLKAGDHIVALGRQEKDERFVAKNVAVVLQRPRRVVTRGKVTVVGDNSLTLETPQRGTLTFTITDETRFRIPGDDDPGLEDFGVGDRVGVVGYQDRDGNLVARGVGKLSENIRQHIVRGEVRAIEGTTLQVETANGPVTVHTDENTRFRIPGDGDPSLDDIAVGDRIGAAGRWNEDGSLQARWMGKPGQ
jgi:hypothetical protein